MATAVTASSSTRPTMVLTTGTSGSRLPGMHNYKKDCADIFPGIEIWTEWIYYVMGDGTMSGTGAYAGSEFALQHQPLNAYYGLQIGEGANNKNENYGGSAWFFYSGQLVVDGVSARRVLSSSGDIFFDYGLLPRMADRLQLHHHGRLWKRARISTTPMTSVRVSSTTSTT